MKASDHSDRDDYVTAVLTLYLGLPETPLRATTQDRKLAAKFHQWGVSLSMVESALLLASVRRLARPEDAPALSPIRSFAYFKPVIEELIYSPPMPPSYMEYLRAKLCQLAPRTSDPKKQA